MNQSLFVDQELTREYLNCLWEDIINISKRGDFKPSVGITLMINSEGGNATESLLLYNKIKRLKFPIIATIFRSGSAATVLVLACPRKNRYINRSGRLTFHMGTVRSGLLQIRKNEVGEICLPDNIGKKAWHARNRLIKIFQSLKLPVRLSHRISNSGVVRLTAEECKRYDIATIIN